MPTLTAVRTDLLDLLADATGVNVFDGDVPTTPPLDSDSRVHPYAVLYSPSGWAHTESLSGPHDQWYFTFQVTCAGGDPSRAARAIDRVRGALTGAYLSSGALVSEIEGDPGPIRRDDDVTPPRHYLPLLFECSTTR